MADRIIPVALRLWLLFLLILWLLGYGVALSIVFGAIGGFAGGTVTAWWQTPGGLPQERQSSAKTTVAMPPALGKLGEKLRPEEIQGRFPFMKVFTRRDRRLSKDRRARRSLRS